MRPRVIVLSIVLGLLLFAAGGWAAYSIFVPAAPAPAPAPAPTGAQVETVNGETVVILPAAMQRAGALALSRLRARELAPELTAYAGAIDPQPLLELASRLAAARAEREAARAQAVLTRAQAARAESLFRDDRNVSEKSLQEARTAAQADRARLAALDANIAGIEATVRQQFGDALARLAGTPGDAALRRLASGQAAILRLSFADPSPKAPPSRASIELPGGGLLEARRLSAAPQVDPMLQGAAWLYLADSAIPAGTRTLAHVRGAGPAVSGVLVPDAAIVWYGDLRWAYVRTAPERFTRRLVEPGAYAADGIIAGGVLHAGEEVVTRGAALLLSEEQRPRGIATQCKDPPECDD